MIDSIPALLRLLMMGMYLRARLYGYSRGKSTVVVAPHSTEIAGHWKEV